MTRQRQSRTYSIQQARATNVLLCKDNVGCQRWTVYDMPAFGHTYGKACNADSLGAGEIMAGWARFDNEAKKPNQFAGASVSPLPNVGNPGHVFGKAAVTGMIETSKMAMTCDMTADDAFYVGVDRASKKLGKIQSTNASRGQAQRAAVKQADSNWTMPRFNKDFTSDFCKDLKAIRLVARKELKAKKERQAEEKAVASAIDAI